MTPQLLTVEDVARALAVSTRTVWRLVSAGELPQPQRIGKRLRRWRASDIEAFVSGQQTAKKNRR